MSALTAETGVAPSAEEPPDTGARHKLTALTGLAALSLDAMASVAYGPEAIVLVLATAGGYGLGGRVCGPSDRVMDVRALQSEAGGPGRPLGASRGSGAAVASLVATTLGDDDAAWSRLAESSAAYTV